MVNFIFLCLTLGHLDTKSGWRRGRSILVLWPKLGAKVTRITPDSVTADLHDEWVITKMWFLDGGDSGRKISNEHRRGRCKRCAGFRPRSLPLIESGSASKKQQYQKILTQIAR